jgi:hypothetical protein
VRTGNSDADDACKHLARAGRTVEAYAEVERLMRVPYAAPTILWDDPEPVYLLLRDDPHYDTLIHHPPRL